MKQKANVPVVAGGAYPTLLPEVALQTPGIDYILRGAGERAIVEFADCLYYGISFPAYVGVKGTKVQDEIDIQKFDIKKVSNHYDFSVLDSSKYVRNDPNISSRVINYISSRGCSFGCAFCAEKALYNSIWRGFQVERMVKDSLSLLESSKATAIKFYDANMLVDKYRIIDYSKIMKTYYRDFKFAGSAHPLNILSMSAAELTELKANGLTRLLIGMESCNDDELKFINKKITYENIKNVISKIDAARIHGSFTFIVGYPTMPIDNIDKTLENVELMAKKYRDHEFKIHFFVPYPGTTLYETSIMNGFVPPVAWSEWAEYDYYVSQMPWIPAKYQKLIDSFNIKYCPYVSG